MNAECSIYVSVNRVSIGSDDGLSPLRHQAIIWTNVGLLSIENLRTNLSEILINSLTFSFKKLHLKMLSAKSVILSSPQSRVKHWACYWWCESVQVIYNVTGLMVLKRGSWLPGNLSFMDCQIPTAGIWSMRNSWAPNPKITSFWKYFLFQSTVFFFCAFCQYKHVMLLISEVDCVLSMWGKIMVSMYRL